MFYQIYDQIKEISMHDIDPDKLTVGYITSEELLEVNSIFQFDEATVTASQSANQLFRTDVDVHSDYTFAELRIVNSDDDDDWLSLYIKKNFILVVNIHDQNKSTKDCVIKAINRVNPSRNCTERLVCAIIEGLISDGNRTFELIKNSITDMEEDIISKDIDKSFNEDLLSIKKTLLKYHSYYDQLLDIAETLSENENEILDEDKLIYISNLENKLNRLKDDVDFLSNSVVHLQDAFTNLQDQKLNQTMKVFTVITTIFFPLTIIVGWYGMNFTGMPELTWGFGYPYVIILSVVVVVALIIYLKIKKLL